MKVLIATGIFEPEAGGPATFAPRIATMLAKEGWEVTVITYSDESSYEFDAEYPFKLVRIVRGGPSALLGTGKLLNRWRYLRALMKEAKNTDFIYALDWFAAGLPVALAARTLEKKYLVRIGGDYAWEQLHCEAQYEPMPLREFYESGEYLRGAYRFYYSIVRYVLKGASHIVFNTEGQRDLYSEYFGLPLQYTSVIHNAVPRKEFADVVRTVPTREIVYWGRFSNMKNIPSLVRAFAMARLPDSFSLALIGSGPRKGEVEELVKELGLSERVTILPGMRLREVLERVKNARAFVLPSWTDISPNQAYESLAIGLPLVITQENFLPIKNEFPLMIDPASVDGIARALQALADDSRYDALVRKLASISYEHGWGDVLQEHLVLFRQVFGVGATRVLQIGADRSKRGILYPGSAAAARQARYGTHFDSLEIIGFSLLRDGREDVSLAHNTTVHPTNSLSRLFYGLDALEIARGLRFDVVSAQDPFETGLVAWVIAKLRGVPLHVQVHTDFLSPRYAALGMGNKARVLLAKFILTRASRIRVVSDRIKRSIEKEISPVAPITVLPIFTEVRHFSHAPMDRTLVRRFAMFPRRVLVVSRLEPEKNVALAIRSFAKSAPKDACLVIVGSGSERAMLDKLVRQLKISDRVFFESPGDVASYFKMSDIVLVPSHFEGYGLVIVEALAAGKPVLSTDVGVAKQVGAMVAAPEHFADALAGWFRGGQRTAHLAAYPYADLDQYVREYCADIASCIAQKSRHNSHTHEH